MKIGAFVPQGWRLDLVEVPSGPEQWQRLVHSAQELERLGYDSLWVYDHFHTVPRALPEATFEAWTVCSALAAITSTIRIGQMCGCNIYRPPTLLAKIAANVDVISNGRLDFGLGAGWYEHETVAYGYPFERPAVRIAQLDEAVQIIKGMWTEERFQFEGKHYRVGVGEVKNYHGDAETLQGAINEPKPVQAPHPPLWIAGGGEQLTLRTVARYADYSNYGGGLEAIVHKNRVLDEHCEAQGRDPAAIVRSTNLNLYLGDDAYLRELLGKRGRAPEEIKDLLEMLGPREPAAVVDLLNRYREEGRIGYTIIYFPDMGSGPSAQRFAEEVRPHL